MASYEQPLASEIQDWTGVNILATGISETELELILDGLLTQAEARAALAITSARFTASDLDTYQANGLKRAVAVITAAYWLRSPQVARATGDHEPLLIETSREIEEVIQSLLGEADDLLAAIAGGGKSQDQKSQWAESPHTRQFARDTVW